MKMKNSPIFRGKLREIKKGQSNKRLSLQKGGNTRKLYRISMTAKMISYTNFFIYYCILLQKAFALPVKNLLH